MKRTASAKPQSLSIFGDKDRSPGPSELRKALGPSHVSWRLLAEHVSRTHAPVTEEWKFTGAKYGWSLRLKKGDRVIVYLIPQTGRFLAGIVLGAAAVSAAGASGVSAPVLQAIADAPRYAEGRGVRIPVTDERAVPDIEKLIALKMAARPLHPPRA